MTKMHRQPLPWPEFRDHFLGYVARKKRLAIPDTEDEEDDIPEEVMEEMDRELR